MSYPILAFDSHLTLTRFFFRFQFGYALTNGTVGVYNGSRRVWRVKSRHDVQCINSFDLDGDGVQELLSGWSNGKFEVRAEKNGESLFKENFGAPISAILCADFRNNGREEVSPSLFPLFSHSPLSSQSTDNLRSARSSARACPI